MTGVAHLCEAYINVAAIGDITVTPNQVRLLEEFVVEKTGKRFTLIFQINEIEEVRRESSNAALEE